MIKKSVDIVLVVVTNAFFGTGGSSVDDGNEEES